MVLLLKKPVFWLGLLLPLVLLVALWRVAGRRPRLVAGLDSSARALAVSPGGSRVVAATEDGQVRVWMPGSDRFASLPFDGLNGFQGVSSTSSPDVAVQLQLSPDGNTVFASSSIRAQASAQMARAWSLPDRKALWSALPNGRDDAGRFWLSGDGTRLIQRTWIWIKVFDLTRPSVAKPSKLSRSVRAFALVRKFSFHPPQTSGAEEVALSRDNKTLIVLASGSHLEFWDIASGQKTGQTMALARSRGTLSVLSPSPDGLFIALCDTSSVYLWNTSTSQWTQAGSSSSSDRSIAWASDSRSLWTGGDSVQLWSAPDLKPLRTLPVSGPVALASDGRTLVTRSLPRPGEGEGVWQWNIS